MKDYEKELNSLVKNNKSLHSGHRARLRNRVDIDPEMRTFADHEMLEFQLSLVIPRRDTNKLAHELINKFGSLESVYDAQPCELIKVKGMTVSAAYLIGTQHALMRRVVKTAHVNNRTTKIENMSALIENLASLFINRKTETFAFVLLDIKYRVIRTFHIDSANPSGVFVAVEDILLKALREGATNIIIAHNHPSGDVSPSIDDITITKRFFSVFYHAGIEIVEHAIFYQDNVFSFNNAGLLQKFKQECLKGEEELNNINESTEIRKVYLSGLTEYMFDPEQLAGGNVKTLPREELFRRYYDKSNGTPKDEVNIKSKKNKVFSDSAFVLGNLGQITELAIDKDKKIMYPDEF